MAATLCLSPGVLGRPVQDCEARHRRPAFRLGQTGTHRQDELQDLREPRLGESAIICRSPRDVAPMPKITPQSRADLEKVGYPKDMLLNGREAILSRVHLLKAEISDIQRLNEQYTQQRRTLPAQQNHAQRRGRLEQIVEELKALTNRKIQ